MASRKNTRKGNPKAGRSSKVSTANRSDRAAARSVRVAGEIAETGKKRSPEEAGVEDDGGTAPTRQRVLYVLSKFVSRFGWNTTHMLCLLNAGAKRRRTAV